jgi:hypothetical protein
MSLVRIALVMAAGLWLLPLAPAAGDDGQGVALIVGDAVRDRGQPCSDPVTAERDAEDSEPDREAWILTCKEARYLVRFIGSERHTEIEQLPD